MVMASSFVDRSARDDGSEQSGRDPRGFVPNQDLGEEPPTTKLSRAPGDADALDCSEDGTVCFACNFVKVKANSEPFNLTEAADAFGDLQKLITEQYMKISNPALVEMILEFYNDQIRPLGDYGPWTRNSIGRHLLYHRNDEDVIMNEAVSMLYAQIQSLRTRVWTENILDGCTEPHHKNLALMVSMTKALTDTLGKRKTLKT
jgi:hypothetical protein